MTDQSDDEEGAELPESGKVAKISRGALQVGAFKQTTEMFHGIFCEVPSREALSPFQTSRF